MESRTRKTIYAAVSVVVIAAAAWSGSITLGHADVASRKAAPPNRVRVVGGEVVGDSGATRISGIWLTDGNIAALSRAINAPAIAASRIELQSWGNDTTMNFALAVFREHAAFQQSIDSLIASDSLAATLPAIADSMVPPYQRQLTTILGLPARELDRRYVAEQVKAHERVLPEIGAMAGLTKNPRLRNFFLLQGVAPMERAHLESAKELATKFAAADSMRKARREAREARLRGRGR